MQAIRGHISPGAVFTEALRALTRPAGAPEARPTAPKAQMPATPAEAASAAAKVPDHGRIFPRGSFLNIRV